MFETIINGLSGLENSGIGTNMSILAHLVYEIWWFYPFWGVLGPICHFLDTLYMFFKNYYILWIHMTKCSKKGQTLEVVSRVILSQIFLNMLNWPKNVMNSFIYLFFHLFKKGSLDFFKLFWKFNHMDHFNTPKCKIQSDVTSNLNTPWEQCV